MPVTPVAIILSGIAIGIVSAILPLGPVTLLVLRRTLSGDSTGALRVGFGRVPAEALYCGLAMFGVVALLDRYPGLREGLKLVGTLTLLVVGVWLLVLKATPSAASIDPSTSTPASALRWGDAAGFVISILNPTFLFIWSVGIGIAVSKFGLQPTVFDKVAFPLALGLGLGLGYVILVRFMGRHGARFERTVQLALRALGCVFIGLALWNVVVLFSTR